MAAQGKLKIALANLRGSLLQVLGRREEAVAAFSTGMEEARQLEPGDVRLLAANLARLLLESGQAQRARELLRSELASPAGLSSMDRIVWHWTRAELALHDKHFDDAWRDVGVALVLTEAVRAQMRGAEQRRAWYARLSALLSLAITVALERGDVALALTLVERTRARSTVDLLATGVRALPAAADDLVAARDAALARRKLLRQIDEALQRLGVGFVDVARLAALRQLDPTLKLTQTSAGDRRMMSPARLDLALTEVNATIARLDERIENVVDLAQTDALGEVLDAAGIRALLDD